MKVLEIQVFEGPDKGKTFRLEKQGEYLLGRSKKTDMVLDGDKTLSRQHLKISFDGQSCKISDFKSKNGFFLNGMHFLRPKDEPSDFIEPSSAEVQDNDKIRVGFNHLLIRFLDRDFHSDQTSFLEKNSKIDDDSLDILEQEIQKKKSEERKQPLFAHYRLVEELGRGGNGVVFKVLSQKEDGFFALKTFNSTNKQSSFGQKAFHREGKITRFLDHPNIVKTYREGVFGTTPYILMEFIPGGDLNRLLKKKGTLSLEEAAPLMVGILKGLAYAHRFKCPMEDPDINPTMKSGLVHRDLKPQNIMLTNDLQPKICDFGLTKFFESAGETAVTKENQVAGTAQYWPREQLTQYRYLAPPSDVFSIGAIFFQLLTGDLVRPGYLKLRETSRKKGRSVSFIQLMTWIHGNPASQLAEREGTIPRDISAVIDRATREMKIDSGMEPADMRAQLAELRYKDAGEFLDALTQAFDINGIEY